MPVGPRRNRRRLLEDPDRAVARGMMKAVGFTDETLAKPQIGVYEAGGMAVVGKRLLAAGLLNPEATTVTGRTLGAEIKASIEPAHQQVVRPLDQPLKREGGLAILRSNLAPGGCVIKLSGQTKSHHRGPARVFEREEDAFEALRSGRIQASDVMVLRNEGPRGGPGMREMQLDSATRWRSSPTAAFPGRPAAS